ncbi:hypothetical protein P152DRAFT_475865 [Eremomyces bilateralis CBS 781.70]|uniref:Uncharacterized protein n=1 Tax=Eremomyces bilateralis CBS 781.70 TaxID=1392243 RepID=A0A6G1FXG2_9PEZI|nr:uncharacterized protein P152DRAFT_475865 [Eremomyces bilateralis CBS 781.70]KAF1810309.1 hypothetical protein P152DRAFT_475865 [Eremomyces bilateralis CBS 781.70]
MVAAAGTPPSKKRPRMEEEGKRTTKKPKPDYNAGGLEHRLPSNPPSMHRTNSGFSLTSASKKQPRVEAEVKKVTEKSKLDDAGGLEPRIPKPPPLDRTNPGFSLTKSPSEAVAADRLAHKNIAEMVKQQQKRTLGAEVLPYNEYFRVEDAELKKLRNGQRQISAQFKEHSHELFEHGQQFVPILKEFVQGTVCDKESILLIVLEIVRDEESMRHLVQEIVRDKESIRPIIQEIVRKTLEKRPNEPTTAVKAENERLINLVGSLQADLAQMNEQLGGIVTVVGRKKAETDILSKRVQEMDRLTKDMQGERSAMGRQLRDLEDKLGHTKAEYSILSQRANDMDEKLNTSRAEQISLAESGRQMNATLTRRVNDMEQELETARAENAKLTQENATLTKKFGDLETDTAERFEAFMRKWELQQATFDTAAQSRSSPLTKHYFAVEESRHAHPALQVAVQKLENDVAAQALESEVKALTVASESLNSRVEAVEEGLQEAKLTTTAINQKVDTVTTKVVSSDAALLPAVPESSKQESPAPPQSGNTGAVDPIQLLILKGTVKDEIDKSSTFTARQLDKLERLMDDHDKNSRATEKRLDKLERSVEDLEKRPVQISRHGSPAQQMQVLGSNAPPQGLFAANGVPTMARSSPMATAEQGYFLTQGGMQQRLQSQPGMVPHQPGQQPQMQQPQMQQPQMQQPQMQQPPLVGHREFITFVDKVNAKLEQSTKCINDLNEFSRTIGPRMEAVEHTQAQTSNTGNALATRVKSLEDTVVVLHHTTDQHEKRLQHTNTENIVNAVTAGVHDNIAQNFEVWWKKGIEARARSPDRRSQVSHSPQGSSSRFAPGGPTLKVKGQANGFNGRHDGTNGRQDDRQSSTD